MVRTNRVRYKDYQLKMGGLPDMAVGGLLEMKYGSDRGFSLVLTSIENFIQTIAHEIAHHHKLGHGDTALYNREFRAIKNYRSRQ